MRDRALNFSCLNNRYFALRHGHSKANEQSIIVSDPVLGTKSYGLSDLGVEQLKALVRQLPGVFDAQLIIISSDFLRTRESAKIIADSLAVLTPVTYSANLRERFFGDLEGLSDDHYHQVWKRDSFDASDESFSVEPASRVVDRAIALIEKLESQYSGSVILLVAHGDVLQLLQCAFEGRPAAQHRHLDPIKVAQVRELSLAV